MKLFIEILDTEGREHIIFKSQIVNIMNVSETEGYDDCNSMIFTTNEKCTISTKTTVNEILTKLNSYQSPLM